MTKNRTITKMAQHSTAQHSTAQHSTAQHKVETTFFQHILKTPSNTMVFLRKEGEA